MVDFNYLPSSSGPSILGPSEGPTMWELLQQDRIAKGMEAVPFNPAAVSMSPMTAMPPGMQASAPTQPTQPAEPTKVGGKEKPAMPEAVGNARKVLQALYTKEGGILGTGLSLSQGMLFALGALATRKTPTHQAWDATLKLMGLPMEIEKSKNAAALEKVREALTKAQTSKVEQETAQMQALNALAAQITGQGMATTPKQATPLPGTTTQVTPMETPGGPSPVQAIGGETAPILQNRPKVPVVKGYHAGGMPNIVYEEQPLTFGELSNPKWFPFLSRDRALFVSSMPSYADQMKQLAVDRQQYESDLREQTRVERESRERVPSTEAIKIFADTGVRAPGVPEGMTQQQARDHLAAEQTRRAEKAPIGREQLRAESLNPDRTPEERAKFKQMAEGLEKADVEFERLKAMQRDAVTSGRRLKEAQLKAGPAYTSAITMLDQLDKLVGTAAKPGPMATKGFLAKNEGPWAQWEAARKRGFRIPGTGVLTGGAPLPISGKPGDPDLGAWLSHEATMVTVARALGDIGPRALKAYESVMRIIEVPSTPAAVRQALGNLREAMEEARKKGVLGMPTVGIPATDRFTSAPTAPSGPTSSGTLPEGFTER